MCTDVSDVMGCGVGGGGGVGGGVVFFFFNDTATTEIYTLSLHDALPILFLSRLIWVFLMALSGSASIAQNWVREAKLGTLDFLRLSPEPPWRILLGKMLGVPALCYVAAIAWLPFHLYLAIRAGSDLGI